jgi:hypothetical protein
MMLDGLRARRVIRAVENGKFQKVLPRARCREWAKFVIRQASIPHTEQVVLRLTLNKRHDPWYLWVIYRIVSTNPGSMQMEYLVFPMDEDDKLSIPENIAEMPYFEA